MITQLVWCRYHMDAQAIMQLISLEFKTWKQSTFNMLMMLDLHANTKLINKIFINIIYIYEDANTILFYRSLFDNKVFSPVIK